MEIQIKEAKPKFLNLANKKPYMRCEPISDQECIVFDKYRFEIVDLSKASYTNIKGIHKPRSKSPAPHMSELQRLLTLRDSIVHITYKNKVLTCVTNEPKVVSYDFVTNSLHDSDHTTQKVATQYKQTLRNKLFKGQLKFETLTKQHSVA